MKTSKSLSLHLIPVLVIATLWQSPAIHAQEAGCDYSDAMMFDGFGWNPTTQQSCAPIVCENVVRDTDGDGFGIQNNQICTVTDETTRDAPVYINQETGNAVNLELAYWDGNRDIANRTIRCDAFSFDEVSGSYQPANTIYVPGTGFSPDSVESKFLPLSPAPNSKGWVEGLLNFSAPNWTVENGVINGTTVLAAPYFEMIVLDNGQKAVRRWGLSEGSRNISSHRLATSIILDDRYMECRDMSGADLESTGSADATPSTISLANLTFGSENIPVDAPDRREIFNAVTGESIDLVRATWNYNDDLAGRAFQCSSFSVSESGTWIREPLWHEYELPFRFVDSPDEMPAFTELLPDGIQNLITHTFSNGLEIDGIGRFFPSYVHIPRAGTVESWDDSGTSYFSCSGGGIQPSGLPDASSNSCDYSNADAFNGWGWDPVLRQSCAPRSTTSTETPTPARQCDYTNADQHGGWGWNPATLSSCPPQTTALVTTSECVDSDGDGWGWDGQSSCRI